MRQTFTAAPSPYKFQVDVEADPKTRVRDWPGDFPPGSPGATPPSPPPKSFMDELSKIRPGWVVAWHPVNGRHCLYAPDGIRWKLAFYCENPYPQEWADVEAGGAIPLDNRVFAFLYDSDPETYGGLANMKREIAARFEKKEQDANQRRVDWLNEIHYGAKLNTSIRIGYGGGSGDRFSRQVNGEGSRERQHIPY